EVEGPSPDRPEVTEAIPLKTHRGPALAVAAVALVLGVGATVMLWPGEEPRHEPSKPAVTYASPVAVTVRSKPFGASVIRTATHATLGPTPVVLTLPPGDTPVPLQVQLQGYTPAKLEVVPKGDSVQEVTLTAVEELPALPRDPPVPKPVSAEV